MSNCIRHILVVDDNPSIRDDFRKIFAAAARSGSTGDDADAELFGTKPNETRRATYQLDFASQGQEGLEMVKAALAKQQPYAMAFLDIQMPPGWDGIETMSQVWKIAPELQIVICTAYSNYCLEDIIGKVGHSDRFVILKKPFDPIEVLQLANAFSEREDLIHEVRMRAQKLQESEQRYRFLADSIPGLLWTANANGNLDYLNQRWCDYAGLTIEQGKNWSWQSILHPDDLPQCLERWTHALRTGEDYEVAYRLKRASDGAYRWHLARARPMRNEQGAIDHWVGTCTDIHDQTIAKELLQGEVVLREKRLNAFFTGATAGLALLDKDLRYLQINDTLAEMNGVPAKEHLGRTVREVIPAIAPAVEPMFQKVLKTGEAILNIEVSGETSRHPGLQQHWTESVFPIAGADGSVDGVGVIVVEITARKQAEQALKESQEQLRYISDNLPNSMIYQLLVEPDGRRRFTYISEAVRQFHGCSPEEAMKDANCVYGRVVAEDQARLKREEEKARTTFAVFNSEMRMLNERNEIRWSQVVSRPRKLANGSTLWDGIEIDITDRKEMEHALRWSESRYRELINCQGEGVTYTDAGLKFTFANPAAESMLGVWPGQLLGKTLLEFLDEKNKSIMERQLKLRRAREKSSYEIEITTPAGEKRQLLITGSPQMDSEGRFCGTFAIFRDVTQRKNAELALRESQHLLRSVLDNIPDPAWLKDSQGRYLVGNKPLARIYQRKLEDIIGKTVFEAFPGSAAELAKGDAQVVESEKPVRSEICIPDDEGRSRWFDAIETPILNESGELVSTVGIARDITERKEIEQALRESENRHRELLNSQDDGVLTVDVGQAFTFVNPALGRILGVQAEELLGRNLREFLADDQKTILDQQVELRRTLKKTTYELEITAADGERRQVLINSTPKMDEAGRFCGTFAVFRDITERKRTEEKLHLQASALAATANGIVITDKAGHILWTNPAFTALTGYSAGEAIGQTTALLKSGAHDQNFYKSLWRTILSGKVWQGEIVNRRKDGGTYFEEMSITPVLDERGAIRNFVAVKQDISQRKRNEEELRAREETFRALADNVPDAVARLDRNLCFTYGNRALANDLGREPSAFVGKSGEELNLPMDGKWSEELRGVFETGVPRSFEFQMKRPEGISYRESRLVPEFSSNGEVEFVLALTRDVTEQKKVDRERQMMDLQLRQAQKMEAIGQLAAGIAHEINTPTQYVGDNTRFLKEAFGDITSALEAYAELMAAARLQAVTPEVLARVEKILSSSDLDYHFQQIPAAIMETLEGVERVTKIVRAMKEFSHPGGREKAVTDINKAINSTVTVARNEWKYVADLVLDLDNDLPLVPCFLGEFNQAILNLVINAAHAISDVIGKNPAQKGVIRICSRREGNFAEVRVSDTGTGIPEANRLRIFEPFFTTKDLGKGTGQGLALVYGNIVKKHGGTVTFETEVGKGTTFILRLPLAEKGPAAVSPDAPSETNPSCVLQIANPP